MSSHGEHFDHVKVHLDPRQDEVYLDSRRGSYGIDGVHSTGSAVVIIMDVAAVQREDEGHAGGQQRSQEEEDH